MLYFFSSLLQDICEQNGPGKNIRKYNLHLCYKIFVNKKYGKDKLFQNLHLYYKIFINILRMGKRQGFLYLHLYYKIFANLNRRNFGANSLFTSLL